MPAEPLISILLLALTLLLLVLGLRLIAFARHNGGCGGRSGRMRKMLQRS